jgi:hypothetical protein
MKPTHGMLQQYLLIISIIAILGITIAFGFLAHNLLEVWILDDGPGYSLKRDLISQLTRLGVFTLLFTTHFPRFLKVNHHTDF